MNVSLSPALVDFVKTKVESGLYNSTSEVVREALRLLQEQDEKKAALKAALQAGYDAYKTGHYEGVKDYDMDGTSQFTSVEEMKVELDRRVASAKQGNFVTVEELRKKYGGEIEEKADLEKIKREQGFTGIDKDKMTKLAQQANIEEPLEDLLNMLTP